MEDLGSPLVAISAMSRVQLPMCTELLFTVIAWLVAQLDNLTASCKATSHLAVDTRCKASAGLG